MPTFKIILNCKPTNTQCSGLVTIKFEFKSRSSPFSFQSCSFAVYNNQALYFNTLMLIGASNQCRIACDGFRRKSQTSFQPFEALGPAHTYTFSYKNAYFFLRFGLPSSRKRRFRSPKTVTFENTFQSRAIRKYRLIVFVWTKSFEYDDFIAWAGLASYTCSVDRQ